MNMLIEKYTSQWIKDYASIKCEIEKGLHGLNLNPHCVERPNLGLKKNIFAKFQTILG
jgi:hypothetical protein